MSTDTTNNKDRVVTLGRQLYLTTAVLRECADHATPRQCDILIELFEAELESRSASRARRLLHRARIPVRKTLDNYDWSPVTLPADITREHLTTLDFLNGCEDLVFYGDVGTGKTHLAIALVTAACLRGTPARFFTAASLVDHLRNAKLAGKLDKELAALGKNELLVIDELGYIPIDTDGARLLFQAIADAYEQRSLIITTNLAFSQCGPRLRQRRHGSRRNRPHRPPRPHDHLHRPVLPHGKRPHEITQKPSNAQTAQNHATPA
ncbi:ATP-binding protein [Corynebacterium auris]|uniref:ATP-binding protein n=1 Tax=Corynebacterium auris TaxID=44750 RepID=UPI003F492D13|nr:transposase [Corynebacterium auris]